MKYNKKWIGAVLLSSALVLGACGNTDDNEQTDTNEVTTSTEETTDTETEKNTDDMAEDDSSKDGHEEHEDMEHDESGEVPEGLKEAENPTYPVGSEVVIENDHMPGMEGAKGEVVGVFDTTAYEVTYDDTETGETVANHKWVIHEELENAQEDPYKEGDEVVLEASHMPGMKGATATIDSAEEANVYMVTYDDTETGDTVENHKWMTEEELAPVK